MRSLARQVEPSALPIPVRRRVPVLFLIDELCREGGAEIIFARMIRLLPRDRFRCFAVTFRVDRELPLVRDFPCHLTVLPLHKTYDFAAVRVAWRLRRLIRRNRIQIVHAFFETSDLWGGAVSKLSGCPILISSRRDMGIQRERKHSIAYRLLGRMFDQVQTVSEAVRGYCIQTDKMPPDKVRTLYNGVNLTNGSGLSSGRSRDVTAPVTVAVGHIRHVKGFDILIRAAAIVCREYPRARFQIVGTVQEADHYRELQNLAEALGVAPNIEFLGGRDDVPAILRQADIFCLPSRSEGLSNALLEAMAAGLPCVATDVGGNGELLRNGAGGYLITSEDERAAADALLKLLGNPEFAKEKGRENRAAAEELFSEQSMMRELVKSYEQLLRQRGL